MNGFLPLLFLTIPFAKNGIPSPSLASTEPHFTELSIAYEEKYDLFEKADYCVDLFLGIRAEQNETRQNKISFYTILNQEKKDYLLDYVLSCFEITHFWTMPIVSLHYSNACVSSIERELEPLLDDPELELQTVVISKDKYEPLSEGTLQHLNPCEEPLENRGGIELPPDQPWIDYRDIDYDNYVSTTYTGLNVKIGVADSGPFYPSHTNFLGSPITLHGNEIVGTYPNSSSHSARVMSVLTGRYGVAPMANTHILNGDESPYNGYRYLDYFNAWGMDVVNVSQYSDGTSLDAYFDFAVSYYGLTLVASCSNELTGNLNQPASAQNVISVCSINDDNTIASGSNNRINNVDENFRIAAVGGGRIVNVYGTNIALYGASFAAPAVTGTIALMMEKNPLLKGHPERVMSALGISANRNAVVHNSSSVVVDSLDSTSGNWSWSGVGALDIAQALIAASLITSSTFSFTPNTTYILPSFYAQAGSVIRISHAWLRTVTYYGGNYFVTNVLSDFNLSLVDSFNYTCCSTTKVDTNVENIEYTVGSSGYYRIRITVCCLIGSQYSLAHRII